MGAQWLSGRVLDSRLKGREFKPHRRHCVVSLSKNINPSLVLVQPRKTRPFITERLLIGRKELNQTKIDHEIISTAILLQKCCNVSYKWKYVHKFKVLVKRLVKRAQEKSVVSELTVPTWP